jgi:PTS system nitrogen regulatory IIA component
MQLSNIITPERVVSSLDGASKKRVLELTAEFIAEESQIDSEDIYHGLIDRERLGSTGIGYGVAIPHCRVTSLGDDETRGYLIQLNQGIDFDSIDGQDVELLFVLLVPESTNQAHLNLLAQLANCFSDDQFRRDLKLATDSDELFEIAWQTFKTAEA